MKKTVLITGSSSGLGRATARLFASTGWTVVATMRDPSVDTDLGQLDDVLVVRLDVENPASIEEAIAAGIERFGHIDVLVNNAGFGLFGVFESASSAQIREQFDVNVFGVMNVTRALLPHLRERGTGVIVNISSGAGVFGFPLLSLYTASKFALEGFSESLSHEMHSQGIVVKIIEPGVICDTSFSARSGAEAARGLAISGYEDVIAATERVFGHLVSSSTASSDDVAHVILEAATDGTDQLRYVATSDIAAIIKTRRETSDVEYIEKLRALYLTQE